MVLLSEQEQDSSAVAWELILSFILNYWMIIASLHLFNPWP